MLCVTVTQNGIFPLENQPADWNQCEAVVFSGSDVFAIPRAMTFEEGVQIGVAIASCWAVAAVMRFLVRNLTT